MEIRREQFHVGRMGEFLDPLNPAVTEFLAQSQTFLKQVTGDPVGARDMALQVLADARLQQAASLAYFDDFYLFAVLAICLLLLVPFMRKAVAEKGAHIGAE
jgi:DHA2 family multidrug resistance protein